MAAQKVSPPAIWTRNFIVISLVNLFVFFSFQMIFPVLPVYVKKLGGTDTLVGVVMGISTVSTVIVRPVTGLLLDNYGKKPVLMCGLVLFGAAVFGYGMVHLISLIIAIRLLHGVGWGFTGTSAATIASEIIPRKRFAEGMGYFSLANGVSMAIAPAVGIYVGRLLSLNSVFFIAAGLAAVSLFLSAFLKCGKQTRPVSGTLNLELYERASANSAVLMFFLSFTYGSIIGFLPLYAASEGIPGIGAFFTVFALTILVTRPLIGRLIDRSGLTVVLLPGFFCLLAGIFSLAEGTTLQEFLIIAFVYGLGLGSLQTTLQTMAVRDIPQCRLGAANATLYTGFDLGMGIGVIILGIIAQNWGYRVMYLFTTVPVVLSILYYVFWAKNHLHVPPGICPRTQDDIL